MVSRTLVKFLMTLPHPAYLFLSFLESLEWKSSFLVCRSTPVSIRRWFVSIVVVDLDGPRFVHCKSVYVVGEEHCFEQGIYFKSLTIAFDSSENGTCVDAWD